MVPTLTAALAATVGDLLDSPQPLKDSANVSSKAAGRIDRDVWFKVDSLF
jgi:hypothetical protein